MRRAWASLVLSLILLLGLVPGPVFSMESDEDGLRRVRAALAPELKAQEDDARRLEELQAELFASVGEFSDAREKLYLLEQRLSEFGTDHTVMAERRRALQEELNRARSAHSARVHALYQNARLGTDRALADPDSGFDRLRLARYMTEVAAVGAAVVRGVAMDLDQTEQRERALVREREDALQKVAKWRAELPDIPAPELETENLVSDLRQAMALRAVRIDRLRRDERALVKMMSAPVVRRRTETVTPQEVVVARPTRDADGFDGPKVVVKPSAPTGQAEKTKKPGLLAKLFGLGRSKDKGEAAPPPEPTRPAPRSAGPVPFAQRRGKLTAPVAGSVIARFGEKHASGATYSGVIARARPGAAVRAIAPGDVVFSGSFPALGNTVIVAHGERYHTVYARLGSIRFDVGASISEGDVVGSLANGDADLHFELRSEGKSTDPLPWLRGGASAFGGG